MNMWQDRFDTEGYVYGIEPNEFVKQYYKVFKGSKKIGAFAEGEGRNAVFLSMRGFMLTAFDFAQSGLSKTKKLASENHVHVATRLTDLIHDETPIEEFNGAVMIFGHFPKKYQKLIFDKVVKSVTPGGMIMMELYSEEQLHYQTGGPKDIDLLYNPQDVLEWCSDYKIKHFYVGEVVRNEGTLHTGLAHVIQFIIQK